MGAEHSKPLQPYDAGRASTALQAFHQLKNGDKIPEELVKELEELPSSDRRYASSIMHRLLTFKFVVPACGAHTKNKCTNTGLHVGAFVILYKQIMREPTPMDVQVEELIQATRDECVKEMAKGLPAPPSS